MQPSLRYNAIKIFTIGVFRNTCIKDIVRNINLFLYKTLIPPNKRHLLKFASLTLLIFQCCICASQQDETETLKSKQPSTFYANTLSVHPFGVFISRINNNFQLHAAAKPSLSLNISTGNVWLPNVTGYYPSDENDRNTMRGFAWHLREGRYDKNSPGGIAELHADGILRNYQVKFNIPISNNQELKFYTRMFSVTAGKVPYALLNSDQFIEWFHSNVAGGEDPFSRKVYGLNQAQLFYMDINGNSLLLKDGDFIFSGIDLSYYYYPNFNYLATRNILTNIGLQSGLNISKVNPSIDLGVNLTGIKKIKPKKSANEFHLGASIGALRQKIINYGNGVLLSNKHVILSSELLFEYVIPAKNKRFFSIATTWYAQGSYHKKNESEYMVLSGQRITTHWHYAISHLYRALTAHSLAFTYTKGKFSGWIYLREDLLVDNAPDTQTGIGFKLTL